MTQPLMAGFFIFMSIKKILKHGKKHCPTCTCGNSPGKGEIGGTSGAIGGHGGMGGGGK